LAADLMSTAIDTTQSVFSGVAKTGETLGSALLASGRKNVKFAGGLVAGSVALELFTSSVSAAVKEGVRLLATEAEKTIKAFNTATSAGALFGRGMDDMRFYATRAGLTIDQFSNVIKNNSDDLARAGYTVEQGARIVGNVTSRFAVQTGKSGQTLQREMLNLGMGFEEQADLTAKIVSDLKRTGGTATNGQVATATLEIAKNMRAVADIMGEEYKARQDAAKKQAEQYAFQAKVNEIARRTGDPGLPKRVELAMSLMSESNRRAAIQATVLGGAVTDVAANLTGGADAGRDFANALMSGRTSMQDLTNGTAMLNDRFQNGTNEMGVAISRATIATGDLAEISQAYDQQQQDSFKANSRNINKAIQDAETLVGSQGGLQNELVGVEIQAQSLKMSIQDILTPSIVKFGKVSNEVLDSVRKAVNKLSGKEPGLGSQIGRTTAGVLGGAVGLGATILAAPATAGASLAVGIPSIVGGVAIGNEIYDRTFGGFDEGGISKGPTSGYQAQLHGTEAVVPLPDGRTIPVEVKDTGSSMPMKAMQAVVDELKRGHQITQANFQDLIRVMKDNNSLTSGILQNTY
jgi:hypothetical protein